MNALELMAKRLATLPIERIVKEAVTEYKPVIEDMNAAQLIEGKDSAGEDLRPSYRNPEYARMKQIMNSKPKPNTPDLRLTGSFHEGITVEIDDSGITIIGTDEKTDKLLKKYGGNIIGLNDANIDVLRHDYIKPYTMSEVVEYLALWRFGA